MWCIYKIENKINGKCYIGQSKNVKDRWRGHKRSTRLVKEGATIKHSQVQVVHLALAKYGINNFIFKVIEEVDTQEEANDRETYWVSYYNSYSNGYDADHGGMNAPKTEEWKKKVKETRMKNGGYGHSEETKKLMSDTWYQHHTSESFQKIAEANRGRVIPSEIRQNYLKLIKGNKTV